MYLKLLVNLNTLYQESAMNIDSLGSETVELLIKENLVNTISDLYLLNTDDLLPLKKDGKKWSENIVFGIENSKKVPF